MEELMVEAEPNEEPDDLDADDDLDAEDPSP